MQAVLGLVLVILSAILAQVEIGDPCGENVGQITKIQDCTTAIIVPDFNGGKNNWWNTPDMVCCVNTSYLTPNRRPIRKSEEACAKFGPAIQRKVSSENYVQPGDYQHNVAIGYWDDREDSGIIWGICCGVLISEDYVVTTATCITIPGKAPPKIRAGTIDSLGEEDGVKPQDIDVLETIAHPDYFAEPRVNDIGLIKLAKPVIFTSNVQPACLYTKKDVPTKMIVTGWGVTLKSASRFDDLLVKSPVLAVNMDNCTSIYKKMKRDLSDSEFCGTTGTHICTTLPGSAAFIPRGNDSRVTIVGLASDGSAECGSEIPIIFTKISNYLDWIESIVWP